MLKKYTTKFTNVIQYCIVYVFRRIRVFYFFGIIWYLELIVVFKCFILHFRLFPEDADGLQYAKRRVQFYLFLPVSDILITFKRLLCIRTLVRTVLGLVLLYIFQLTQKDVPVSLACLVRSGQQVTLRAYDRYFSPGRLPVGVTFISFYVLRSQGGKKTKNTNHTKRF